MTITDEMLAAYVDGELEGEALAAVESAIWSDAALRDRIARDRALRRQLREAYDPVLQEPVPERLLAAARGRSGGAVVPAAKVIPLSRPGRSTPRVWPLHEGAAMAASLFLGALLGAFALHLRESSPIGEHDGRLIARGSLAGALSTELASRPEKELPVAIGVSFLSDAGEYCRTFTLRDRQALAGVACRRAEAWQIAMLTQAEGASGNAGPYRQAASPVPQLVLDYASAHMSGEPLDARSEAAARAQGWRRP